MGAEGTKVEEDGSDILQEPDVEEKVPLALDDYPKARPPAKKKEDIFNIEDYKDIDNRASNVPDAVADSFEGLIDYLTRDLKNDLQKMRAIFIWLGRQKIDDGKYLTSQPINTPKGCMKLMQEKKGTYATFFALLCRAAKIPCVIIKGKAKSVAYEVGMTELECQNLNNSWNAVYAKDGWRFVHPLWAYRAIVGHSLGYFTKVEIKGEAVRKKEQASSGRTVTQLNEYYFLTNPEEFIFSCFPNMEEWQLLHKPWTFLKFVEVPECTQTFFEQKVELASEHKCILNTLGGECSVAMKSMKNILFNYELYYNEKESSTRITQTLQLQKYVLKTYDGSVIRFQARFAHKGIYKLQIVGSNTLNSDLPLCSFKIFCNEAKHNCQPLPISPLIGFGPSEELEKVGIKAKSHKTGIVQIMACKEIQITFETKKTVSVETTLIHNTIEEIYLKRCISQTVAEKTITVSVRVIQRGEYVLQMFAKSDSSKGDKKNVCNYLLTSETGPKRTRTYENGEEKKARSRLTELAQTRKDLDSLENAIESFQKHGLDDEGDLSFAIDALERGRLEKDLKNAVNRRRLDCLEKAITHASESKFRDKLHSLLSEAEEMRDDLKRLEGYSHGILELNSSTIAELRRYKQPPQVIHDVMIATFLLLGEKKKDLQILVTCKRSVDRQQNGRWSDVFSSRWTECREYAESQSWEIIQMHLSRPQDLIRRVKQFDPMNVGAETYADVSSILQAHTLDSARKASAGAGTFYDWAHKMSEDMVNRFGSTE